MNKIMIITLLLAVSMLACSEAPGQGFLAGDSDRPLVYYPTGTNGTYNGAAFTFDNQNTSALEVGRATEFAIWVNCTGTMNVTSLKYQTSPDGNLWSNGLTGLSPCIANLTKYEIADKGVQKLRFEIVAQNGSNVSVRPLAADKLLIALSTK